ncbi:dihydroorotate dehydrogenase electron transfer subunit [Eubacteriaceae bacterium ES3]|nr:dihydroorotate dehydrogenase electron transfer subunit [Eubacteriaceae bacterium ES3]
MAIILENVMMQPGIMKMTLEYQENNVLPGQFFMLRAWDKDPLLSRPISVFDFEPGKLVFLYQVVGKGTQIFQKLNVGDSVEIQGPYGNGFPEIDNNLVIVGGGIGVAPLFYLAKNFKIKNPTKQCRAYLGFRDIPYTVNLFESICDEITVNVGGIITDDVKISESDTVMTCGPEIMMKALSNIIPATTPVYVSLEAHMACGIGACLGCTCQTKSGNKKVCKDGPVFLREEVFDV